MSKIEINHLTVDYTEKKKSFTALKDVNFSIEEGEFVSVIGSSGCGKSTLLSILEGINTPTDGEILINGEAIKGTGMDPTGNTPVPSYNCYFFAPPFLELYT